MKAKILLLLLLFQSVGFAQEMWRPLGYDDFNGASYGAVRINGSTLLYAGRNPLIVKNDHVFLFNIETADYSSTKSQFSVSKYSAGQWEHFDFPFLFPSTPITDGAVDSNEIPYVFFNDITGTNLPVVKKYENGIWTNVGADISTSSSSFLNINIGTDNLPWVLFSEGNIIKLKKFNGSNWVLVSETTEFNSFYNISLQLDNNNIPYVVTNSSVCFVKKFNGVAWEEVGITGFVQTGSSLVFDNFNVPHMYVGGIIKKFTGTNWVDISTIQITPYLVIGNGKNLFFNSSNDLYASFVGTFYTDTPKTFVKKLVNTTWQSIVSNGNMNDKYYSVSNDNVYHLSFGSDYYPDVNKMVNGQFTLLGDQTFSSWLSTDSGDEVNTHDFSICNGVPLIAFKRNGKAAVNMFVNDNWTNLGALQTSENNIRKVMVKAGTDGKIYLAYNNQLSTTESDTKITVKQLGATGWEAVGPVNFSLTAGTQFDFKLSHANEPYVVYMSGRVQKFDGTNWVFVGGSAFSGDTSARLALDNNDLPYIAYLDPSNSGHISVKKLNGNVWEYVDQAGLAAYTGQHYNPRIVIDAANNLYMGFSDNAKKIHIKKLNNGLWESVGTEFFSTVTTPQHQYEMAIDHNNVLHVVYNELSQDFRREAKLKKFNGTNWEFVGEPNFSPASITQAKIDFWGNNTPIVSYSSLEYKINTRFFGSSTALGVSEQELVSENQKWLLTPNPVTNTFTLNGNDEIQSLEIYDMTGKKVKEENTNFNNIDISSFRSGLYIVKVKSNNGTGVVKLVKE